MCKRGSPTCEQLDLGPYCLQYKCSLSLNISRRDSNDKNVTDGKIANNYYTVKPVLSGHLKMDKIKNLLKNGRLMKVQSIAECSKGSILQYF